MLRLALRFVGVVVPLALLAFARNSGRLLLLIVAALAWDLTSKRDRR